MNMTGWATFDFEYLMYPVWGFFYVNLKKNRFFLVRVVRLPIFPGKLFWIIIFCADQVSFYFKRLGFYCHLYWLPINFSVLFPKPWFSEINWFPFFKHVKYQLFFVYMVTDLKRFCFVFNSEFFAEFYKTKRTWLYFLTNCILYCFAYFINIIFWVVPEFNNVSTIFFNENKTIIRSLSIFPELLKCNVLILH